MKVAFLLTSIFLLSLVISCTQQNQSPQSTQQGKEAQAKPSPAATIDDTSAGKSRGARGTPAEARAMLEKAVEYYKEVGRTQALADFTGRKSPFFDRDLYVACIGSDHILTANGGFPSLVGSSTDAWRDADGKSLGKAIWDAVSSTGEGSVKYRWFNPVSGKIEPKINFSRKLSDDICGVGAYNPQ